MYATFRFSPLLFSSLLAGVAGCGAPPTTEDEGSAIFHLGTPDELVLAEDMAYETLFQPNSPALAKGVDELRTTRVHVDDLRMAHTRVQQLHNGVPVFGGEAIVHFKPDGALFTVTDDLLPDVSVDTTPDYTADEAMDLAAETYYEGWDVLTDHPTTELFVLRHEGKDHLVWRVQLHRTDGTAKTELPVMFIDAHTGDLVWSYNNLQTATCSGATNAYGTVSFDCYTDGTYYYLEDTTDKLGTYTWNNTTSGIYYVTSSSTTFSSSSEVTRNAVEAHYTLQQVYDYFYDNHGRDGINGSGGPGAISSHGTSFITSTASYSTDYVNAYWDPTGYYMVYGDGDGYYSNALTTLDVGGHELTHGVTQFEANLTYSGEPGHLNESMSDVFGAMVERSVLGESSDTWLIGEDTWTPGTSGDALRYMNDPADDGYSYDYYTSSIGSVDVHYGSGVPNLVFYLLSEGGTHPRGKSSTSVTGIGADDAADIWYLALSSYMTSSTNFSGARTATLSAAAALYGSSSTQYTQVGNAWAAVGVGSSGGSSSSCTTSTYTGSFSRRGSSTYKPSSSGTSVTVTSQTVTLTGPSSADFDLYLQKKSGSSWSSVASSTGDTSEESISYSGTSGTYRIRIYSYSGSGSWSASWCK